MDSYVDLEDHLQSLLEDDDKLEMESSRVWSNVCMRYVVEGFDLNDVNFQIRERMMREGRFMVSSSKVGDIVILRPVIANPAVTRDVLDSFVESAIQIGDDIVRGLPSTI